MRRAWLLVIAACGRIHVDPLGGAAGDARGDGTGAGDGAGLSDGGVTGGSGGETCNEAREIPLGQTFTGQTIAGASNDFANGTPCTMGGIEVVYSVITTTSGQRTITLTADFDGVLGVGSQCPIVSGTCLPFSANIAEMPKPTLPAGTTFLIVDKTSGPGTTFSLGVQ